MLKHEFVALSANNIPQNLSYSILSESNYMSIPDDVILEYSCEFLGDFSTYWDCIGNIRKGLNYHGITIICTEDLPGFVSVLKKLKDIPDILYLLNYCQVALDQNKNIIHFGV